MSASEPLSRAPGGRERLAALLALAVATAALAFVAWGGLGKHLVYSWGPSELIAAASRAHGATVRLGGIVAEGSVTRTPEGVRFAVTDGRRSVPVQAHGLAPPMFREGIAIVAEGTLGPEGVFDAGRLMVSHGNEYRARTVADGPSARRGAP